MNQMFKKASSVLTAVICAASITFSGASLVLADGEIDDQTKTTIETTAEGLTETIIPLTDEQIEALGKQARLMFDDELKNTQTDADFYEKLKEDIGNYNSTQTRISSYVIQSAAKTKYSTFKDRQYASIALVYYLRQGDKLIDSPTKFTLRKDNDGHWKILYWELTELDNDAD